MLKAKSFFCPLQSHEVTPVFSFGGHGFKGYSFTFDPFRVNFVAGVRCGSPFVLLHVTIQASQVPPFPWD